MNKFIFFILFLAISLGYLFEVDETIAKNFNPFNSIKRVYINTVLSIQRTTEKYFGQVTTIQKLQEENEELKPYKLLYKSTKSELDSVLETVNNPDLTTPYVSFVNVLSYIDFDNFTKVWLDMQKKDNTILGLISQGYAAGIVVNQKGKAKALLNGNEKCNYAIFIGDIKAPGIIHASKNARHLVAKYVPIWLKINVGDEVITSGMDNIFFEGLKVGKVISIKKMQDTQEATILPYANVLKQKSFIVYKRVEKEPEQQKDATTKK